MTKARNIADIASDGSPLADGVINYGDITGLPTLGTVASTAATDYATAGQGTLADSATQPGDLHTVATTGAYSDLTGKPTLGTAAATNATAYATAAQGALADTATQPADVATAISNLVDTAPSTLDTLNELAAALGDDPNFATTVTNSIATKLPLAGGAMTGAITTSSTFDGRDVSVDGTKLDGIEAGATADQTASEILTAIKTVDGTGSGLDADLLDGNDASAFATSAQGTLATNALPKTGGAMTGAITTNSTFDGRDVSVDGAKLDGIAAGANNYSFPYTVSDAEGNSTIAQRTSSGYLHASYFNGTGSFATSGASSGMATFTGGNGGDTYARPYNATAARALLNVADGATNVTNTNQLTNGAGYITGYTETDTFSTVATRGNSYINANLGGISVGETFTDYNGWNTQLNVNGNGHCRLTVKTDLVRMGMYAHNTWQSVSGVTPGGFVGTYNDYPLSFLVNTQQKMVINTSGNVGIGVTSPTQKLDVNGTVKATAFSGDGSGLTGLGGGFPAGTRMVFQQTSAPTGWTKDTTAAINNSALRFVTGTAGSGGSVAFTTAFASQAVTGTNGVSGSTTLTTAQMPSHNHSAAVYYYDGGGMYYFRCSQAINYYNSPSVSSTGGGGSHNHGAASFTGNAIDLTVKYYDLIIGVKN